jgi:glycosyltransferase involved in cell wall biosynthesis
MDDDDWYFSESVACRIRILLEFEKFKGEPGCFGCTKVLCLDLITNSFFEAYDASDENLPATISESTMAYSKKFWSLQKFDPASVMTECIPFINERENLICSGPSTFVVVQFTHGSNTVSRKIRKNYLSDFNYDAFERNLSAVDIKVINDIRASVIKNLPTFKEAIDFVYFHSGDSRETFEQSHKELDYKIKCNPLVIDLYREKMITNETKASAKTINYYCGPGKNFCFSNKWNPDSKQLGGSEEAVINLSKELTRSGYKVIVYSVLEGPSRYYDNVLYKNHYEWVPRNKTHTTIIWRDPSNCLAEINSNVILDLHDSIPPGWLIGLDPRVHICTKSKYHTDIIRSPGPTVSATVIHSIPNGIYCPELSPGLEKVKNMIVCTSSPDRCLTALLRALPIIREKVPDAEIHWAYGFSSSIDGVGMENDHRTKEWVQRLKKQISNTPGFVDHGRLSQTDVNDLYKRGDIFMYLTRFPEIDCISLTKAMYYGCIPVVSPSGAISEKIRSKRQYAKLFSADYDYSLESGPEFDTIINYVIKVLTSPRPDRKQISDYARNYEWDRVCGKWEKIIKDN